MYTICPTGIEDLCGKRDELHRSILQEEEEKQKLQNDIRVLTERLAKVNESLAKKMASRNEFDKTIAETEAAYMKVRRILNYTPIFVPAVNDYNENGGNSVC